MTFIRFVTGKSSGILSDISSGIRSGILSGISSGILPGISSDILSGRWGPAVPTELGSSQVEVQRCPLGSEGLWLRSSGAHCARNLAVEVQPCPLRSEAGSWGPAVPTARGSWRRDWRRAWRRVGKVEVGEGIGEELARRKWTWKLMQTWSRRNWRRRRRRRRRRTTALIKSNNPHLAGGEIEPEAKERESEGKMLWRPGSCSLMARVSDFVLDNRRFTPGGVFFGHLKGSANMSFSWLPLACLSQSHRARNFTNAPLNVSWHVWKKMELEKMFFCKA